MAHAWNSVSIFTAGRGADRRGLGGVFKEKVWYLRFEMARPTYRSQRDDLRHLPRGDRWRGGLPLRARDAIFPADVEALRGCRADVLVTHEAPTCRQHGVVGIDIAAEACRARLVVHGYHHESYAGAIGRGIKVRGPATGKVFRLREEDLR